MSRGHPDLRLLPGDCVGVKSREEIFRTLDGRGCLAGLPFMPEMLPYCGRRFRVWRRVEKSCVEGDRVRRMESVVFLGDLRYGTWRPHQMLRFVCAALALRVRAVLFGMASVKLRGTRPTTETDALNLQPGECLEVKSRSEIAATLDLRGRNRGLEFPIYTLPFCGRRFRVRKPVHPLIQETTGEMREIRNTVTLECATCDGYGRWGGCPRDAFHLWREISLRRVPAPASDGTGSSNVSALVEGIATVDGNVVAEGKLGFARRVL